MVSGCVVPEKTKGEMKICKPVGKMNGTTLHPSWLSIAAYAKKTAKGTKAPEEDIAAKGSNSAFNREGPRTARGSYHEASAVPRTSLQRIRGHFAQEARLEDQVAVLDLVAHWLRSAANPSRLRMLHYCRQPRTFSQIMWSLSLNPNSLDTHARILSKAGLLEKTGKRPHIRYVTTERGRLVLQTVLGPFQEAMNRKISQ